MANGVLKYFDKTTNTLKELQTVGAANVTDILQNELANYYNIQQVNEKFEGYADKNYVDTEISKISVGSVDLTGYYNSEYIDQAFSARDTRLDSIDTSISDLNDTLNNNYYSTFIKFLIILFHLFI